MKKPPSFLEPLFWCELYKGCIFTKRPTWNAGNLSTEMEGNIPWIILSFLLFMQICYGKSKSFNMWSSTSVVDWICPDIPYIILFQIWLGLLPSDMFIWNIDFQLFICVLFGGLLLVWVTNSLQSCPKAICSSLIELQKITLGYRRNESL